MYVCVFAEKNLRLLVQYRKIQYNVQSTVAVPPSATDPVHTYIYNINPPRRHPKPKPRNSIIIIIGVQDLLLFFVLSPCSGGEEKTKDKRQNQKTKTPDPPTSQTLGSHSTPLHDTTLHYSTLHSTHSTSSPYSHDIPLLLPHRNINPPIPKYQNTTLSRSFLERPLDMRAR